MYSFHLPQSNNLTDPIKNQYLVSGALMVMVLLSDLFFKVLGLPHGSTDSHLMTKRSIGLQILQGVWGSACVPLAWLFCSVTTSKIKIVTIQ